MKTDAGIVVEASEKAAQRLSTYFGWKRTPEDPMPVEDVSDAVRQKPTASNQTESGSDPVAVAPKRKPGRPKKVVND